MLRSIKAKIGLILIINFVFICVTILSTFITLNNQETDGVVINLAGRQRMLSQKMTKEVLLGQYDKVQLEALKKTASNFENVLNGLINGDSELNLPKTDNEAIAAGLLKVQDLWKPFYDNIKQIVANTSGLPEEESLQYIKSQNMSLMLEMDQVVKMFESEAIEKNSNLKQIQLLFLCITALVVGSGFYFMNKIIIKPVLTINETAKKNTCLICQHLTLFYFCCSFMH